MMGSEIGLIEKLYFNIYTIMSELHVDHIVNMKLLLLLFLLEA